MQAIPGCQGKGLYCDKNPYWLPVGLLESDLDSPLSRDIHVTSKTPWEVLDEPLGRLDDGFEL